MNTPITRPKYYQVLVAALLLVFSGISCSFSSPMSTPTTVIQTVPVTQVVTQLVTQEVTQEVTLVVEVPETITPSDTPLYTYTPSLTPTITGTPTDTPTPGPPQVTILENSACLYGPGSVYLYKYGVLAASQMEVVGRNLDGTWLYVEAVQGWNPCWVEATLIKFTTGDIQNVPLFYSVLPHTNEYQPPVAKAHRKGSDVTVSWPAVRMSLDDYRGYLIEAWVCQGGTQVFIPTLYAPALAKNYGILSVDITDEPGCTSPSSVRIYSAAKRGYSAWTNIPWPVAYAATPTP